MKLTTAIDLFVADWRAQGRIASQRTEEGYRAVLELHAHDVANRDPRLVNRDDIKRTLRRWEHPNTSAARRAALVSFYDWAMEEGHRRDNPARQVPRPRRRQASIYRLTREEAAAILLAARSIREIRAVHLGICAGLRSAELRGLRGEHLARQGWIHVTPDIAKGSRERWVPVIAQLAPLAEALREQVPHDHHVLAGHATGRRGDGRRWIVDPHQQLSSQRLQRAVHAAAARAGIHAHVTPHSMRHAFADHVARWAGLRHAQFMLGHADVSTTQGYVGQPSLDELRASVEHLRFIDPEPPPAHEGHFAPYGEGGIRTLGRDPTRNDGDTPERDPPHEGGRSHGDHGHGRQGRSP